MMKSKSRNAAATLPRRFKGLPGPFRKLLLQVRAYTIRFACANSHGGVYAGI